MNVFFGQNSFNEFVSRSKNGTKALCSALERALTFDFLQDGMETTRFCQKNQIFQLSKFVPSAPGG